LLGEEVIVVGYGTVSRKDLTGSVSQVSSRELTQVSVANATELITGRVAGLMAKSTSGLPGSDGAALRIRGYENPLVLVDGVEMSFDRVDPNDIESISVLKDASAAIYGARAGNGVILVTTKRGDRGQPRIDIRSNVSFEQPTQLVNPVNAAQYAEMIREGEINGGINPSITLEEIEAYKRGDPGFESYNWYNAVFRPWAPTRAYNGSVSGGSDEVVYFLSAGNMKQESAFRSGDYNFERYNIRANVDTKVRDYLSVYLNFSARVEGVTRTSESQDEIFGGLMRSQPIYNPNLPNGAPAYAGFGNVSPKAISYSDVRGLTETTNERVEGAFGTKWKLPFVSGFEAEARLNYRYISNSEWANSKAYEVFSYDELTDTYTLRGGRGTNSVNRGEYRDRWLNPVVSLRYAGVFGDHNLSGLAVAEYIDEYRKGFSASRLNPISPDVPFLNAGSTEGIDNSDFWTEGARVSYIGRLQYGYQDRYRVESTVRADATHKFAPGSRWGVFPSISGSWSLHNESFFKVKHISELRFRVSFSQTGDDTGVAAYRYLSDYIIRDNLFMFDDQLVQRISEQGLPNPDVTWLEMTSYNYGVNLGLFNQKLTAEFNLFQRKTDNIFGTALDVFPSTFGAVLPPLNINAREDQGYEVEVAHKHRVGEVSYAVSANLSHSREKYTRWAEPTYDDPDEARLFKLTGSYVNRFIGYKSNGMFMTQEAIDNHEVDQDGQGNVTLRPGDIRYVDRNDDGKIDFRDQTDIGRGSFPDMSYGFSFDVSYKGFSLNALFQGASKFNLNMIGRARGPFDNDGIPHVYQYKYRWTPDPNNPNVNINPDAKLPAIEVPGIGTNVNNNLTSDFWLRDGTYLRLKNLNLSYTVPSKLVKRAGLNNLRLYVAGSNLYTWDRLGIYSGSFDPEVPVTSAGRYPNVRTVTFGIDVQI
jgi:TonB-linked SusC/RagA family outer membrane protein